MTRLCRRYGVTRAEFHAWAARTHNAHAEQNQRLLAALTQRFTCHHGRYGSPRIHHLVIATHWVVSRRRVAQFMRTAG